MVMPQILSEQFNNEGVLLQGMKGHFEEVHSFSKPHPLFSNVLRNGAIFFYSL